MGLTHLERLLAAIARELGLTPEQLADAIEAGLAAYEHDAIARANANAGWEHEDTQPIVYVDKPNERG